MKTGLTTQYEMKGSRERGGGSGGGMGGWGGLGGKPAHVLIFDKVAQSLSMTGNTNIEYLKYLLKIGGGTVKATECIMFQ